MGERVLRNLWRRFIAWFTEPGPPIVIKITETRSPDWEGDAKRWREERGYN